MLHRWLLYSLLLAYAFPDELFGFGKQEKPKNAVENAEKKVFCGKTNRLMHITARHIEGNGIGYNQGYTSLDSFLTFLDPADEYWIPFIDLRGHIFNNGKPAANAGVGVRYIASQVWGINAYYDYRKTSRYRYNQASLGFECLGRIWDFRLNGYLPVGNTKSSFSHPSFHDFRGHHLILSRKREFAMKGANAEVGFHMTKIKDIPFYFAVGPYYLNGQGKHAWGGQARVAIDLLEYVRIEGNTSYDQIFKEIFQGQLSLIIPFGPRKNVEKRKRSCSKELALWTRATQRVDRNEIIPVDKKRRKSVAIDPSTKEPYFFSFVDNTSHSKGTFESPFNTLFAAQESSQPFDIIYVFPGDGSYTGMNAGIILKDNQKLLGSANSYLFNTTKGKVRLPAFSSTKPLITNSADSVVICANNNEIAGMHLTTNNNITGISCAQITNASIHENTIDAIRASAGIDVVNSKGNIALLSNVINVLQSSQGLLVETFDGAMKVSGNTFNFDSSSNNFGVHLLVQNTSESNYVFEKNQFMAPLSSASTGFELGQSGSPITNFNSLAITNNLFVGLGSISSGGKPIGGFGFGGTGQLTIENNLFSNVGAGTNDVTRSTVLVRVQAAGDLIVNVRDNQWQSSQDLTFASLNIINKDSSSSACVTLNGNQSDVDIGNTAYVLDNTVGGIMIVNTADNVGTVTQTNTTPGTCP